MRIAPEIGSVSVVFLGAFNPVIFRPDWFGRHGLVSQDAVDSADVEVIHKEICHYRMGWFDLTVNADRFSITVTEAPYIRLQDLLVQTFRTFLSHTPIHTVGINRTVHFKVASVEVRNAIGRTLAPPEAWGEWGKRIADEMQHHGIRSRAGLNTLIMQQGNLEDRPLGFINTKIQPSARIQQNVGIYIEVNDHYQLEKQDATGADEILDIFQRQFEPSISRSEWIIDQVMALA